MQSHTRHMAEVPHSSSQRKGRAAHPAHTGATPARPVLPVSLASDLTPAALLALQRTVGNQAVNQLLRRMDDARGAGSQAPAPRTVAAQDLGRATTGAARPVQRSIGLEIEVSVPVDQLTAPELQAIRNAAGNDPTNIPTLPPLNVMGLRKRAVPYTRGNGPRGTNGHFRAEVDHDPRVNTEKNPAFPYRDMNNSALLEIVTEPKANKTEFDTAMDQVDAFVNDVNARTGNLTQHADDPYGSGHNIGPIDYPALGPMPRQPNHNWQGSIQVNIGIDMREYASLAKWYAKSRYANPARAERHNRADYKNAKANIEQAVKIGRSTTAWMAGQLQKSSRRDMGNLRGLRGWATHMALYMLGGKAGLPEGSTAKNITPILMKSPNDVAVQYAMTPRELGIYRDDDNRKAIVAHLIELTGRTDLDPHDPLAGDIVRGKSDEGTLDDLSGDTPTTLFAGAPIAGEQAVGPARTGQGASQTGNTTGGQRGGAVVEFRNVPGFYDGPASWRRLGYDFLREAENRNKRGGDRPDKLSALQSDDWA